MRVQRSRKRRLTGRKPGSKSPVFEGGAAEPTTRSSGISWMPAYDRPSRPAASSTGAIDCRRRARRVRIELTERVKARKRAASKSSSARIRSNYALDQGLFALRVEEVQAARVQPELNRVAGIHAHSRVDARGHLVAADLPIEELVGTEALHDVDLHLHRGAAFDHLVGDRFRPEPKGALGRADRLRKLDLEPGGLRGAVVHRRRHEVHGRAPD